jgi:hypothetical protein
VAFPQSSQGFVYHADAGSSPVRLAMGEKAD